MTSLIRRSLFALVLLPAPPVTGAAQPQSSSSSQVHESLRILPMSRVGFGENTDEVYFCGTHDDQPAVVVVVPPVAMPGAFGIIIDYGGSGFNAAQQAVFDAAIAMWEAVIQDNGGFVRVFQIDAQFVAIDGPGGTLAVADMYQEFADGIPLAARIRVDNAEPWFVDPTPFDNSEYTANGFFGFVNGTGSAVNFDMLTVILHEIGHALGWTVGYTRFNNLVTPGPGGLRTFDLGGFEITLVPQALATHADRAAHPGDLMVPTINSGMRRLISFFPSMTAPQRAYNYTMPLTFVNAEVLGLFEFGTAFLPYDTFAEGIAGASPGDVLIIKAGAYPLDAAVVANEPVLLWSVLGAAIVGE